MSELFRLTPAQDLYPLVLREVRELRMSWAMFVALYGTSQERVDLLGATAPITFGSIQERLRDAILLRLTQLTANKREGGRKQVCFDSLIAELKAGGSNTSDLERRLAEFRQQTTKAEVWRDKRLAHYDQDVISAPNPLPTVKQNEIATAILSAVAILGEIDSVIHGSNHVHNDQIPCDVDALIRRLEVKP